MPRQHTKAACALISGEKADTNDTSHLCVYLADELGDDKNGEYEFLSTPPSSTFPSLADDDDRWVEDSPLTKAFRVLPLTAEKRMLDEPSFVESDSSGRTIRRSHVQLALDHRRLDGNGSEMSIVEDSGVPLDFIYRGGFTFVCAKTERTLSEDDLQASLTAKDIGEILGDVAQMTNHCWEKGQMITERMGLETTARFQWPLGQRELTVPGSEESVKVDVWAEISATYSKKPRTESTKAEDKD